MRSSTCALLGLTVLVVLFIHDASAMYLRGPQHPGFVLRSGRVTRRLTPEAHKKINTLVYRRQLQLLMMWSHKSHSEVGSAMVQRAYSMLELRAPMYLVVAPFIKDAKRRKVVAKNLTVAGRVMRRRFFGVGRPRRFGERTSPGVYAPTKTVTFTVPYTTSTSPTDNDDDSETSGSGSGDDDAATTMMPIDDEDSVDESSGAEAIATEPTQDIGAPRPTSAGIEASGSGSGDVEVSQTIDDEDGLTDEEEEEELESGSSGSEDSSTSTAERVPTTSVAAAELSVRPTMTTTTTLADISDDEDFAAEKEESSSGDESSGSGEQSSGDEPGSAWDADEPPPQTTLAPSHVTQLDCRIEKVTTLIESYDPDFDLVNAEDGGRSEDFGVLPEENGEFPVEPPSEEVEGPEDGPIQEERKTTLDEKTLDSDEDMPLPKSGSFGASNVVQEPEVNDYYDDHSYFLE